MLARRCALPLPPDRRSPLPFQYDAKLCELLDTHTKAFLVHADNVGSKQFMDIRAVRAWAHRRPSGCSWTGRRPLTWQGSVSSLSRAYSAARAAK